jgi:DNA-binding NarL/FixJ family response regulator
MRRDDISARRIGAAPRPRVLIADSQAVERAGLRSILEPGLQVCAEAGDATTALRAARGELPEIAIVAADLSGGGMALTAEIARRLPTVRIVMLAEEPDDEEMLQALRVGASGYLPKATNVRRLAAAIGSVLGGEGALTRAATGRLVQVYCDRAHRRLGVPGHADARLTDREWDVLELMREGLDTAAMASRLGISRITVRRHASSVVGKLGVTNRAAAVRLLSRDEDDAEAGLDVVPA